MRSKAKLSHKALWQINCVIVASLFFSGCGYSFSGSTPLSIWQSRQVIGIPYVEGDRFGHLTAALIKQITSRTPLLYSQQEDGVVLKVVIINKDDENIGFRYDRKNNGRRAKYLIPVESRSILSAQITLVDRLNDKVLQGPVLLTAQAEFDHDYYISQGANVFSLGQLTDVDGAKDAVLTPLYQRMAEKITDYILDSW